MQKRQILKQYFGYDTFREGQEEIIDNILNNRDVMGIMPTGAGKSLCFQIPALVLPGITIVISPLVSLMKDQVQALVANGISAAYINSTLTYNQTVKALQNAKNGKYKIIYVAPERLDVSEFLEFAIEANISMITIDEAHCISQWGQNFRPSYLKIRAFIEKFSNRPVVSAFTATATIEVKNDIIKSLALRSPLVMITGFDRKNLYFEVQKPIDKYKSLSKFLKDNPSKSGIIYCSTRKTVEEVCSNLIRDQYHTTQYHAGLDVNERVLNQDDFLYDRTPIMVATNAFGMGIDKSNVSFVIHYNMPKNLESYYQEAGRAGRDGSSAQCILFYGGQDVIINQLLLDSSHDNGTIAAEIAEKVKEKEREKLKQITYYCHSNDCLREYILKYFGEKTGKFCDNCSSCHTNFEEMDIKEYALKIFSCIVTLKERFGIKMVIDTLRGSKSDKIVKFGYDKTEAYGTLAELNEKRVRDIMNFLVLNDYLILSNSQYPVVSLTEKSREFRNSNTGLIMKIVKNQKNDDKITKNKMKLDNANNDLFQKLKDIRLLIAKEKKVPAFMIFSDATLIDMCRKNPVNKDEMLEVSGVGTVKLEQYGNRFLEVLKHHSEL